MQVNCNKEEGEGAAGLWYVTGTSAYMYIVTMHTYQGRSVNQGWVATVAVMTTCSIKPAGLSKCCDSPLPPHPYM